MILVSEIEEQERALANSSTTTTIEEPGTSEPSSLQAYHFSVAGCGKRISLPNLAQAYDQTGVSDRSASILVNAVLQDFQIITKENPSKIVGRGKIRREQKKRRRDGKKRTELIEHS